MTSCQDLYTWADIPIYEWVDESFIEFGECSTGVLNQIWKDSDYVYTVTSLGLNIFDINTTNKVASVNNSYGFTTIWGNESFIYLGTSSEGLKYLEKTTISGGNLSSNLKNYNYTYNTTSNNIKYIHGYADTLSVVTSSGIDILRNRTQGYKSTFFNEYVTKCFITSKNELYYIIQDTVPNGVYKVNSSLCDWQYPDTSYETGVSFLPAAVGVNDLFITENTSSDGTNNTLFVATTDGAIILDEGTSEFDLYYSKEK